VALLYILKKIDFQQIFKASRRKPIAKFHGLKRLPFKDNERSFEEAPVTSMWFSAKSSLTLKLNKITICTEELTIKTAN